MSKSLNESIAPDEMPRERMARLGPGALSNAELLALLLRVGTQGENVMDLSERILRELGGFRGLSRLSLDQMRKIKGIGLAKAVQIGAALEIAGRLQREQVKSMPLNHPQRVYDILAPQMATMKQESLQLICCDTRLRPVSITEITRGISNQTLAHPPEILKRVLIGDCENFIIAHNHPSGDTSPSQADRRFTKQLKEASDLLSLKMIDHVIIGAPLNGRDPYFSFSESGNL